MSHAAEHARLIDLLGDLVTAAEIAGPSSRLVRRLRAVLESPEPNADYDPEWPWAPLSPEWWKLAGNRVAASEGQMRFAAAWCACGDSARAARFAGMGTAHKQNGHRALNSVAVTKLLRAAWRELMARRHPVPWKLRARFIRDY
jgi:hypothetical protein